MNSLSEAEKAKFMRSLEVRQYTDSMHMYNSLVDRCFEVCTKVRRVGVGRAE